MPSAENPEHALNILINKIQYTLIVKLLKSGYSVSDEEFDEMYVPRLRRMSETHFTPVEVAKTAADFLVTQSGTRVLDVGSGAGKFCMVGAACTKGYFTGVEQRTDLSRLAESLSLQYRLDNIRFIHSNIKQIDFTAFDAIYFYNSFYENIVQRNAIDHSVDLHKLLYIEYSEYMKEQLRQMPSGTRLATYFSYSDEIPEGYIITSTAFDCKLKLWEKVK